MDAVADGDELVEGVDSDVIELRAEWLADTVAVGEACDDPDLCPVAVTVPDPDLDAVLVTLEDDVLMAVAEPVVEAHRVAVPVAVTLEDEL